VAEHTIKIPEGSAVPDGGNYDPDSKKIKKGDTIIWDNQDLAAHTVTSGTPETAADGKFDSGLFMSQTKFSQILAEKGTYPYFCLVHPWKKGKIIVE